MAFRRSKEIFVRTKGPTALLPSPSLQTLWTPLVGSRNRKRLDNSVSDVHRPNEYCYVFLDLDRSSCQIAVPVCSFAGCQKLLSCIRSLYSRTFKIYRIFRPCFNASAVSFSRNIFQCGFCIIRRMMNENSKKLPSYQRTPTLCLGDDFNRTSRGRSTTPRTIRRTNTGN